MVKVKKSLLKKKHPKNKSAAKPQPKKSTAKKTSTPAKKMGKGGKTAAAVTPTPPREIDKVTGFTVGSDQDVIAKELLAGGKSRAEIGERVAKLIPPTTRNGTPKPITNLVSSVYNKLVARGFRTEESFKVLTPTPASKRKATLAAKGK